MSTELRSSRDTSTSLIIRNVPEEASEEELRSMFQKYGSVSDIYIPLDYYTRRHRGFAYIQFEDVKDAENAVCNLNRVCYCGRELEVAFACADRKHDPSKPIRWAIIGAGKISGDFCLALRTLPSQEHQIVAVAARSVENAKSFAEHHGIKKFYGSYDDVAVDPDVDVVYIGTLHPTHVSLSIMMLEAGKNVLCEKPMALSSADVKRVIEVAQRKRLLFIEGVWTRFFPVYKQLRAELKDGSIGTPKGVIASFGADFDWEKLERIFKKEHGGGVVLDLGCYVIQLACLVFNNERPEKIYVNGSLHHTGVDKSADIMLCYKDGRTAKLTLTGECRLPNNAVIHGTKGFLEIPSPFWAPPTLKTSEECYTFDLPKTSEQTHFTNSVGFVYEIQGVRHALLNGLLQASEMTHVDSLLIAEIQDEILRQLGVSYDGI